MFNSKTTAEEVATHFAKNVRGRHFIVTGGYGGIGVETVKALLVAGGRVTVAARDPTRLDAFVDEMQTSICDVKNNGSQVDGIAVDLADLDAVALFVEKFKAKHDRLDVLINNAGMMSDGKRSTPQGVEMQMAVNVVAPYLLTELLLPMLKSSNGRVVFVSSVGHSLSGAKRIDLDYFRNFETRPYDFMFCYQQTKLGDILLAKAFQDQIETAALHPGAIQTGLMSNVRLMLWLIILDFWTVLVALWNGFKTPQAGAATTLLCATTDNLKSGAYYEDCNEAEAHENTSYPEDAKALVEYCQEVCKPYL
mmetsp:Transcript_1183/g.2048  ORF Transcript_1183/g.2048 Transcript_1183/m.2048 type:complete len:308 (-) Transcript_1183:54-977(-)